MSKGLISFGFCCVVLLREFLFWEQETLFGGKNYVGEEICNILALSGGGT